MALGQIELCAALGELCDRGVLDDFCFQAGNGEFEFEFLTMTQLVGAIMN